MLARAMLPLPIMNTERQIKRDRCTVPVPEPCEQTTYKEDTTVTCDASPRMPGPPQETGTSKPHD
jgi:hypothetical protein